MIRSHGVFLASDARFPEALACLAPEAGVERIERFDPHGLSWVRVAGGRTVVLHSWPEHGLVTVDVYASGPVDLVEQLAPLGWVTQISDSSASNRPTP